MKKSIFILMAVVFGMTACTKDEVMKSTNTSENFIPQEIAVQTSSNYTTWEDNVGCHGAPSNCLPPVIIIGYPDKVAASADLVVAINNGPVAISDFFTVGDYSVLFPDLNNQPVVLSELQSGNYQGTIINTAGTDHYLLGDVSLTQVQLTANPFLVLRTQ